MLNDNNQSVSLIGDATALMSLRESDFDAYSAYGEAIDNSIQASAQNIYIYISSHPVRKQKTGEYQAIDSISFVDDGIGMDLPTLHRCLQLGYSTRLNDRKGIGRFGVGMTLGAINQCKRVEVFSKQGGNEWLYTYIDLDEISESPNNTQKIPNPIPKSFPKHLASLSIPASGTIVIWSKYDKQPCSAEELIQNLDIWAGRTYRKFIWGMVEISGDRNAINIEINGKKVKAIDPLHLRNDRFPQDPPSQKANDIEIPWPTNTEDQQRGFPTHSLIKISLALFDKSLRAYPGIGGSNMIKERSIHENEGISILRNGREVFYGHIPHWKTAFVESDRFWGCEISFEAHLDRAFTVKNIKRGAIPITELKKTIIDAIDPTIRAYREDIQNVFKAGKLQRRSEEEASKAQDESSTGHDDAERIAQKSETEKKSEDDATKSKAKQLVENLYRDAEEKRKSALASKFASHPYSIVEGEWKSPEFMEIIPIGGSDVIKYNTNHPFIIELLEIVEEMQKLSGENLLSNKLKSLIDLLIISYAKTESKFDKEKSFRADRFLEDLKMNWGIFLKNYTETWKDEFA